MEPVTALQDMSERELAETVERYRALVDNAREYAIFTVDTGGSITSWNAGAERVLGYTRDEIIGEPLATIFTPEDIAAGAVKEEIETAEREGRAEDERWHMRKDGTRFWVRGVLMSMRGADGKLMGFSKVMRDETERKRAEEDLRQSERRYRMLVEEVRDYAIYMLDPEGRIATWNQGAERIKGYREEEILGKPLSTFYTPEDIEAGIPQREIEIATQQGRTTTQGIRVGKGGARFWGEETMTAMRDEHGALVGFSKITRDVSEQRRRERERSELLAREQSARADAELANRVKDEFISVLSHELRTPLQAILGWVPMIRGGKLDAHQVAKGLEVIERNARAQTQLIEDLLDTSRIATGKLVLDVRPIELAPVVASAIDVVRPAAIAKGIEIESHLDPAAGPIAGDPNRLQQVAWNLLSNAIKFTPRGGRVAIWIERSGSDVELRIKDSGKGIRQQFLAHVFEPFRQADSTSTRAFSGLGLGLAIVRHLVELHGGTVEAESPGDNLGATFTVRLPRIGAYTWEHQVRKAESVAAILTEEEPPIVSPPPLDGVRVLLVEDDDDAREVLAVSLRDAGAHVVEAQSASLSRVALEKAVPDVLIADIGMPEEDGIELIRSIRALPRERGGEVPAIALTAYAREEERARAIAAGFQIHVAKPVEAPLLAAMVKDLLARVK